MGRQNKTYWKTIFGIPLFKIDWYFKYYLYKLFGFTFDKLKDQQHYWNTRGREYFNDFFSSGCHKYEIFFQDILVEELKNLEFSSCFEAGCGFGWNVKRIKQEFPQLRIAGLDFSMPQLLKSREYLPDIVMPVTQGDDCAMPFKDKSFDVGFTLGVYMNIHPRKIDPAIDEMLRVTKKYIIHLEWDQENTLPELREKRIFKTNIISHNYRKLYESRGKGVIKFLTYNDFKDKFYDKFQSTKVSSWRQFEGPAKYILIVIKI